MPEKPNAPLDERRTAAWIGKALHIEGRIVSRENLTIDGEVEGTIELGEHSLDNLGPRDPLAVLVYPLVQSL